MIRLSRLAALICVSAIAIPSVVLGDELIPGKIMPDGRTFLYRELIEGRYFNNWSGMKVSGIAQSQVYVHILGEGKTVGVHGVLSINCTSGSGYYWETAANYRRPMTEADLNRIVPLSVIANSKDAFCK